MTRWRVTKKQDEHKDRTGKLNRRTDKAQGKDRDLNTHELNNRWNTGEEQKGWTGRIYIWSSFVWSLAPLKTRSVSFSLSAPWFTSELRLMKAKGRQVERLYRKTGFVVHKDMHKNHVLHYRDCIAQTKSNYYCGIICSNKGNPKPLFSLLNNIIRPPASNLTCTQLPSVIP